MHPILTNPRRLGLYLLAWLPIALFLAMILQRSEPVHGGLVALAVWAACSVYASICLSAWYPVRALPVGSQPAWKLVLAHGFTSLLLSGVWVGFVLFVADWAADMLGFVWFEAAWMDALPLLLLFGMLLYLASVAIHYLVESVEESAVRERRVAELSGLAREAELRTLKAQVNPHFLFNSLNSIGALTLSDAEGARRMAGRLAEFFRAGIALGKEEEIPLSKELELVDHYLSIEQIRLGERLQVAREIEDDAITVTIPPLLLQPLVENAIVHGIARMVEGGTVRLAAVRRGGHLLLTVENPLDPESGGTAGEGVGLENVRQRLRAQYGEDGHVWVTRKERSFEVQLDVPAS